MATTSVSTEREQAQEWNEAAIAFPQLRLEDEAFDDSLPDRVYLHPMSDLESTNPPQSNRDVPKGFTDVYISMDNPREFIIGETRPE